MKEPHHPLHPHGKAARADATTRAENQARDFAVLFRRLAIAAPGLAGPHGPGPILEDIRAASMPGEWNTALARLVTWALHRAAPPDLSAADVAGYQVGVGHIATILAKGFVAPAIGRPSSRSNVLHDAHIIRFAEACTVAEAVAALDEWERASLLPGQMLSDCDPELSEETLKVKFQQRQERLRKRVMRANKAHNLGLQIRKKRPAGGANGKKP